MDQLAVNTRKSGDNYIPEMPKISQICMMPPEEVFVNLSILETSIYKGNSIAEIASYITVTEGYRYLTELSILNEKEKSGLADISDKSYGQEQGSSVGIASISNSIKSINCSLNSIQCSSSPKNENLEIKEIKQDGSKESSQQNDIEIRKSLFSFKRQSPNSSN